MSQNHTILCIDLMLISALLHGVENTMEAVQNNTREKEYGKHIIALGRLYQGNFKDCHLTNQWINLYILLKEPQRFNNKVEKTNKLQMKRTCNQTQIIINTLLQQYLFMRGQRHHLALCPQKRRQSITTKFY